jgi:hypothetical protein
MDPMQFQAALDNAAHGFFWAAGLMALAVIAISLTRFLLD